MLGCLMQDSNAYDMYRVCANLLLKETTHCSTISADNEVRMERT